jgi:hypothetical protein
MYYSNFPIEILHNLYTKNKTKLCGFGPRANYNHHEIKQNFSVYKHTYFQEPKYNFQLYVLKFETLGQN